ncbi:MAG TPA: hypothetical protein VKZ60_19115 [Chloroflexota bacterium]|nr:hypothetical protein [Chloroflexota bacterium]
MQLLFEIGDPERPRGHALVYFRAPEGTIVATYLVVLPIAIELGKYVPPMFAGSLGGLTGGALAPGAMPLPPLPEVVESVAVLERLARLRHDDLVCGGALVSTAPDQLLAAAARAAQEYAERFEAYAAREPAEPPPALPELDAEEVLLQLMSDRDRLGELAKRTGQLRYAVEGNDPRAVAEAVAAMERVARYLAPKYRVAELIAAARQPGPRGQRLADLYLQRAYKLAADEFDALPALDAAIAAEQQAS